MTSPDGIGLVEPLTEHEESLERAFASMVSNVPMNVIFADTDGVIRYMNPSSVATLRSLEQYLPCKADQIVGQSYDIFHAAPEHQRKLLGDPDNLPHRAQISVGPETLELLVTAVTDDNGIYLGPLVTWEVITERLRVEAEVSRVTAMMDCLPINVMFADREGTIQFMNRASLQTLRTIESLLPCSVDEIVGQSFDIFHKDPPRQRRFIQDPNNMPHKAKISLGDQTLDLRVHAIYSADGEYLGPMATWEVITEKLAAVSETVKSLADSSDELLSVSSQISAGAEETATQASAVSSAADEVTQNVQVTATAAEELSASIEEIAKNSAEAAKIADSAVQIAGKTNTTITQLGNSSGEIGQVIKVITSIAQQTNLLALNATIEAARAGEAGKGFAVVANEVKELAKETAKATEDIGRKIEAIQKDTGESVEAISQINEVISQISDYQNTIASAVEEQTATTNEISRSMGEAAKGSAEIAETITGVAQGTQDAARGASTAEEAAGGLAKMATSLKSLLEELASNG